MGKKNPISQIVSTAMDPLDFTGTRAGWAQDGALASQERGAAAANSTQERIFNQTRADQEPWRQAGATALGQLGSQDFQRDFTAQDFQKDPGYDFRMQEGMKALERSASARGGLMSGGTAKALQDRSQDIASSEYNNAYNRFNNDRTNRFNRLSSVAGVGQTANAQMQQAGQNYGNNVSANQIGMGNAGAANQIGKYNSQQQGVNNALQIGTMMASDERVKTNITPISLEDIQELRSVIKPYTFNYANDIHGEGDWVGVMAQDLEKSRLGRTLVEEIDGVKKINLNKFASVILATMAAD